MPRIKTNVIIAEIEASKIASLDLKAPIGVGVDLDTGELTETVKVEPDRDPVLKYSIIPGKLINVGFLRARLTVERDDVETTIYLPIYSVTNIEGIQPGDHVVEVTELEHLSVSGLPDVVPMGGSGYKVKILIRALLKAQITVTREEIVSLPEEAVSKPAPRSDRAARWEKAPYHSARSPARSSGEIWHKFWAPQKR